MAVSVNVVIAVLISIAFLAFLPGLYIYHYFIGIVFEEFQQPLQMSTLIYELIKRGFALIACPVTVIIYSDMAFPFVLACFGQILQRGGFEVENDETLAQRKKETLLKIQDRSHSLSDERKSSLQLQSESHQKPSNDECISDMTNSVSAKDSAHSDTMAEFFCGRDISLCAPVIQSA